MHSLKGICQDLQQIIRFQIGPPADLFAEYDVCYILKCSHQTNTVLITGIPYTDAAQVQGITRRTFPRVCNIALRSHDYLIDMTLHLRNVGRKMFSCHRV